MAKTTKQEKSGGSEIHKIVIQKGVSRSGRAIKPKAIFGETIIEIAKNNAKVDSLKAIAKVVKPKPAKSGKDSKQIAKKSPAKMEVLKKPAASVLNLNTTPVSNVSPKLSPKSSPTIPKGFTPVDISAIMSAKQVVVKPKTDAVVTVPQRNNVNNLSKVVSLKRKQSTFEEREKEIKALRARLKTLEALQEEERKARAKTINAGKVVKKTEKATVVSDDRPARAKKPTWKAIEQE